jgi:hypothetical protein
MRYDHIRWPGTDQVGQKKGQDDGEQVREHGYLDMDDGRWMMDDEHGITYGVAVY